MGNAETESSDAEVTPLTTTRFPNAGIDVEITVKCEDCFQKTGSVVEMEPKEIADRVDNGAVFKCPDCGKQAALGRYNHGRIKMIDRGEKTHKANADTVTRN